MKIIPTERRYEKHIEKELTSLVDDGLQFQSKTHRRDDKWYNKKLCVIESEFIQFLKESQDEGYQKIRKRYGENTNEKIIARLNKEISVSGLIHVLRKGFNDYVGGNFKVLYFQSTSSLNTRYRNEKYLKNRFLIVRQLHYSIKNSNSIDLVIFMNGIPILTIELKNQLTGQSVDDAKKQYKLKRNPKGEPLLEFNRCICHFSADNDQAFMTTKLEGDSTSFLPFNKTLRNSETKSDGYKVDYLWKEILTPTSLLDIIENLVLLTHKSDYVWNNKKRTVEENRRPVLIFPRYHQLDVLRKLKAQVLKDNVGTNYLIQHTTGSGKSLTIGWLAFMLMRLFRNNGQERTFDSIVIITDRKVIDNQLQDTIKSLEKVDGVVKKIDKNSEQLREALSTGKNIIVTTIQKFSFVLQKIKELRGNTFAVIVDEAHSSQGGKSSKYVNQTLSIDNYQDLVNQEIKGTRSRMQARQKHDHISFFGFTGTPKAQTLEIFGTTVNNTSEKIPFHTYTMKQSIGEGFTMDVLKSFTPVNRWFKLKRKVDDVEIPERETKGELIKWVDSNSKTISMKCAQIKEHLLRVTINSVGGRGKGMIVVRSKEDTVKFFNEMNRQLKDEEKIKCVVAFSGKVDYQGDIVDEYSLNKKNGFDYRDIPKGFKNPLFRVLIVCDKFQTGFDEPLLHSMFIDKKLQGLQCVQTLSRLNRKAKGKVNTFILDFVNKVETVRQSFQNFYQTTILSEHTDPNLVYDILNKIRSYNLFTVYEIEEWNNIFNSKNREDSQLHPILNRVLDKWKKLSDEEKELSKKQFSEYCKFYLYISMIYPYDNQELEEYYVFFEYLRKKFPLDESTQIDVSDMVDLESVDLYVKESESIVMEEENFTTEPRKPSDKLHPNDEYSLISEVIKELNELYGSELPQEIQDSSTELIQKIIKDEEFIRVLNSNNTDSNKKIKLSEVYDGLTIRTIDPTSESYELLDNTIVKDRIIQIFISRPTG